LSSYVDFIVTLNKPKKEDQEGRMEKLYRLRQDDPLICTNLNQINNEGKTPLYLALEKECFEIATLLVNNNAGLTKNAPNGASGSDWSGLKEALVKTTEKDKTTEEVENAWKTFKGTVPKPEDLQKALSLLKAKLLSLSVQLKK
jgi:hypothetical protein